MEDETVMSGISRRSIGTALARVVAVALALLALGPVGAAMAEEPPLLGEAPAPVITSPANDSLTKESTPTVSGTTNDVLDQVTITILGSGPGGPTEQTTTASPSPVGGAWSAITPPLADGTYTVTASQTNTLTGSGSSPAVTFTVDTTPPTVTLNQPPSPSNDTKPSFSGSTSDATPVTVDVYAGSTAKGQVVSSAETTPSGGSWASGEASPALPSGEYTAQATQRDNAGNVGSSAEVTFTVDTSSPTVTLNQPPSRSNNTRPSFSGSASGSTPVTVDIYAGSTAGGKVVSTAEATPSGGNWVSGSASPALSSGEYTAVATEPSSLGNPAGESAPVTFTVDTSSPTVTLNHPASPSNDTRPSFSGSASGSTPVTVDIYEGSTASGEVVSTAEGTPSGGNWVSGSASPALSSGRYTAVASEPSSLGNPAGESAPVTFTVDTSSPTVTLNQPPSRSNNTRPSFSGSASGSTPVTVDIYAGSTAGGKVVSTAEATPSGGNWVSGSASPALSSGRYTAVASEPSSLGNPAGESAPVTFTVDTSSPTVTLNRPPSPSNNTRPSFSGSASDSTPVTVDIYSGSAPEGEVVSSTKATPSGGRWASGKASPPLPSGEYTAVASEPSSLGNPAGASSPVRFIINTAPPTVTLNSPASPSNNTRPSFGGSASDTTPVTVDIYAGSTAKGTVVSTAKGTPEGGSWASGKASPALPNGQYTAVATEPSSLGNPAGASSPETFTVDTAAPTVTLKSPVSPTNDTTPSFAGSASDVTPVTVDVYAGASAKGAVVATAKAMPSGGNWVSGKVSPALPNGQYTAAATQSSSLRNHYGVAVSSSFLVDATPPQITLTSPINGSTTGSESQTVTGTAGTVKGDLPAITIQLFAGSTAGGGEPLESVGVNASKGLWSVTFGGLGAGSYAVRALQSDQAGNVGVSSVSTFTVTSSLVPTAPPQSPRAAEPPPTASFTFFPTAPNADESVSLASNSTDAASPIVAYAWDLLGNGQFQPAGPVLVTSFATPGSHVVRLRVTAADGLSSVVAETIAVAPRHIPLMQPFPIVRIVGSNTGSGARLSLLSVQAPVGARVTVGCRGGGCPTKRESRIAVAGRHGSGTGTVLVAFRRFERSLRVGASLEIRVSKPGEIGKYTRFRIRRNRPPLRVDSCLGPTLPAPIACPSS